MHKTPVALAWLGALIGLALVLAACGGGDSAPASRTPEASPPGPVLRIGSNDIAVGPSRIVFALLDAEGRPVGQAGVRVRFYYLDGPDPATPRSEGSALYLGSETPAAQALYSARAQLDGTGGWALEATLRKGSEQPLRLRSEFRVKARSDMPAIGAPTPHSTNQTLRDAPIEQLTSERPPGDPDFYRLTIAEALDQHKPLMIVFSTPAFCQTQTCGPQLDVAQALKQQYGGQMSFIHIEVFERPDLLLDGKGELRARAAVREWRLQIEPVVFLVDAQGLVADRFEGFTPRAELEASVRSLLGLPRS